MKKGVILFIIVIALCLAVLAGGFSSKTTCPKRSYLCSSFTLAFAGSAVSICLKPDGSFSNTAYSALIYHKEFLSAIFHPPKHLS